jgi:hypothetical protein
LFARKSELQEEEKKSANNMSLQDVDRRYIKDSLAALTIDSSKKGARLSRVVPWLGLGRECKLIPRVGDEALARFRAVLFSEVFDTGKAAECFNILRADLMPKYTDLAISVESCPLVDPPDPAVCTAAQGSAVGCDACAGRSYYAKTDGDKIWMSAELFTRESRTKRFGLLTMRGVTIDSFTEFVMLHEFSHVMQDREDYFRPAISMYNEARALVPPELISNGTLIADDADALEFAANSFAYESARSDRSSRGDCK